MAISPSAAITLLAVSTASTPQVLHLPAKKKYPLQEDTAQVSAVVSVSQATQAEVVVSQANPLLHRQTPKIGEGCPVTFTPVPEHAFEQTSPTKIQFSHFPFFPQPSVNAVEQEAQEAAASAAGTQKKSVLQMQARDYLAAALAVALVLENVLQS
jgi:hypothetical protein